MTIAHLSDTHLGFAAYSRTNDQGLNQRTVDVMATFQRALDAIVQRDPDVVVHAGDLFHRVSPTNHAIMWTFGRLAEFQKARRHKPFVLIGGNHDTPNMREVGCILNLFSRIDGIRVAVDPPKAPLEFAELDLEVLCVPDRAVKQANIDLSPQTRRRNSILVRHGSVQEVLPKNGDLPRVSAVNADRWTYVALGDWHDFRAFAGNCAFAGATDFCTTDIWSENREKGWVWFDTANGSAEFVAIETRPVVDLPPIHAASLDAAGIVEAALRAAEWQPEPAPIVRQRVVGVHPDVARAVPRYTFESDMLSRCLHYQLDLRSEALERTTVDSDRGGAVVLEAEWEAHVERADVPRSLDRAAVVACGLDYLQRTKDEADPA